MPRPSDLPDFDRPPLVEVVLSVQFADLRGYRTVHAGLLWERKFRESFPEFAEKPALDPVFETFGPKASEGPRFTLEQVPGPPVPRLWFLNKKRSHLVQVQANRFLHNWRRVGPSSDYPRYESLKRMFLRELADVSEFLEAEHIGLIEVNQCEVTYVNIIKLPDGTDIRVLPDRVLRQFAHFEPHAGDVATVPRPESTQFASRYVIEGSEGEPIGRLHISGQPMLDADQKPALRLDLTARGTPTSTNLMDVSDFLDVGRDKIVRAFTAITTAEMHELWGRTK